MRERRRQGFTLVEMIIVVAILGILATIAVPNFIRMQTRSRTSEAYTNLALLRDAQLSHYAEAGNFLKTGSAPGGVPGVRQRPWLGANTLEFRELLGFRPDGDVYFQYGVNARGDAFTLSALSDLDGEGPLAQFGLVHAAPGTKMGVRHEIGTCSPLGVYDRASGLPMRLDTIGPCGPEDGKTKL